MSMQQGKVISLIILERFGEIVEKVASYLFKNGSSPLLFIKRYTNLPLPKIREALCILIKYGLVTFVANKNDHLANYKLESKNVMLILRYPKYLHLIKKKFGDEAVIILEEILLNGYASASELILTTASRMSKDLNKAVPLHELKSLFLSLTIAKYVKRIPVSTEEKHVPDLTIIPELEHDCTNLIDLPLLSKVQKNETSSENFVDKNVYWTCNFDRFHQDMRDRLIEGSCNRKYDENIMEIMRVFLQQMYTRNDPWVDVTNPIPAVEIKEIIRKSNTYPHLVTFFDNYLATICDDSNGLLFKAGDAGGGSYQIRIKGIITALVWETVEQIILEKFDTKAARIFRLVRTKKYIEPDNIQKLGMIPAKDAKKLTYQLLEENFLELQELRKASGTGPNKCFTLFYVRIDLIARMVLELCFKTLYNTMTRRNHNKFLNRRLIDKKQRVDAISLTMRTQGVSEEQMSDVEEMITPPERDILESIEKAIKKLNVIEMEIDDTLFLVQLYLDFE